MIVLSSYLGANAQQLPQFSQYMFNEFIINPALAGVSDYFQIKTNHRFQWIGLTDAPITNSISFYGPHPNLDMGYGGTIYTDITGPTSRTGISGSYAYNIKLFNDVRLSMGLSFNMLQYKIDGTQFHPKDASDAFIQGVVNTNYVPDAGVGAYMYGDNFYAGISAAQLLNNKLEIFDNKNGLNRLKSHLFVTGGYRYEIDRNWALEPSAIIKVTAPREYQFEINTRVEWMNMIWLGTGYRFHDAISIIAGYNYDDKFYFGYSYDIGITDIRSYNTGSHEIMIGYRFNDIK